MLVDNSSDNYEFFAAITAIEYIIRSEKNSNIRKEIIMKTTEQLRELEEKVALGLEKAYKKMVAFKKLKNSPLEISKNSKAIGIPAEKILPTAKTMHPYPSNPSYGS